MKRLKNIMAKARKERPAGCITFASEYTSYIADTIPTLVSEDLTNVMSRDKHTVKELEKNRYWEWTAEGAIPARPKCKSVVSERRESAEIEGDEAEPRKNVEKNGSRKLKKAPRHRGHSRRAVKRKRKNAKFAHGSKWKPTPYHKNRGNPRHNLQEHVKRHLGRQRSSGEHTKRRETTDDPRVGVPSENTSLQDESAGGEFHVVGERSVPKSARYQEEDRMARLDGDHQEGERTSDNQFRFRCHAERAGGDSSFAPEKLALTNPGPERPWPVGERPPLRNNEARVHVPHQDADLSRPTHEFFHRETRRRRNSSVDRHHHIGPHQDIEWRPQPHHHRVVDGHLVPARLHGGEANVPEELAHHQPRPFQYQDRRILPREYSPMERSRCADRRRSRSPASKIPRMDPRRNSVGRHSSSPKPYPGDRLSQRDPWLRR